MSVIIPIKSVAERACDGCTKCCEGWLTGTAWGFEFSPNRPCHFITKNGCGIYEYRPYSPCKTFKCAWKTNLELFPEELKPSISGVIFVERATEDYQYVSVVEAGKPLSVEILHWIVQLFTAGVFENITYQYGGVFHRLGRNEKFLRGE